MGHGGGAHEEWVMEQDLVMPHRPILKWTHIPLQILTHTLFAIVRKDLGHIKKEKEKTWKAIVT